MWTIALFRKPLADARGPAEMLAGHTRALQLIDFGRSIDMTMFLPGTTFMVKVETDGFQCIEMKTDRPWTYQVRPSLLPISGKESLMKTAHLSLVKIIFS